MMNEEMDIISIGGGGGSISSSYSSFIHIIISDHHCSCLLLSLKFFIQGSGCEAFLEGKNTAIASQYTPH